MVSIDAVIQSLTCFVTGIILIGVLGALFWVLHWMREN